MKWARHGHPLAFFSVDVQSSLEVPFLGEVVSARIDQSDFADKRQLLKLFFRVSPRKIPSTLYSKDLRKS